MMRFSVTEAELPLRMRRFLADIDEGKVFSSKSLRTNRCSMGSALRGLVDTARSHQFPAKLNTQTAEAYFVRLLDAGWQTNSLGALKSLLRHYAYETDEGVDWALASAATDRRPLELVFRSIHWAPFRALIPDIRVTFTKPEIRMIDRWLRHKKAHARVDAEMVGRFSADHTTFSKLAAMMSAIDPENLDNVILQQAQRNRKHLAVGYIKSAPKLPYHDLPEPFATDMAKLFNKNCSLSFSRLKAICSALRRLCSASTRAGLPTELTMETCKAFVDTLFEDDLKLRSIAGYCDFLACFAKKAGYRHEIYAALMEVHNAVKLEANTELRRKEHKLAQYPIDLVDVAATAHRLLNNAFDQDDIRKRRRDYVMAGALALLCKLQLRSGDLRNGLVGKEFVRDSEGWSVDLTTSKTGTAIKGRLAAELTRYLDAVLLMDVSEAHLWSVYTQRIGTALFGNPSCGWQPFGKNWLWHNMTQHLHHGPHIVRTLIYDAIAEDPYLDASVAQALCGHGSLTSRKFYEVEANRHRQRLGTELLGSILQGLNDDGSDSPISQ